MSRRGRENAAIARPRTPRLEVDQRLLDRAAHGMGDESAGRMRKIADRDRSPVAASRPMASRDSRADSATSNSSQPLSEHSPQPVAPSPSVTATNVQFVFGETLTTTVSIAAIVAIGAALIRVAQ